MKSFYGFSQAEAVALIEEAGFHPQVRGEALTLEEIARLARIIHCR